MEINKLADSFQSTLYKSDLSKISNDAAEILLDSNIESGILKDVPIFFQQLLIVTKHLLALVIIFFKN
ncbi:MAG: hypothetical protein IPL95_07205 [Saprospiraceae bacterium]|nr:hypothetical protein [Saprospiraceae bacterium]